VLPTDLRTRLPGAIVTVAPAPFRVYISQLRGGTAPGPGRVDFADRITHIWTNAKAFLVAVRLARRASAPGFDAARSTTMQQFAVVIP
jgi:hypothetical protein